MFLTPLPLLLLLVYAGNIVTVSCIVPVIPYIVVIVMFTKCTPNCCYIGNNDIVLAVLSKTIKSSQSDPTITGTFFVTTTVNGAAVPLISTGI